MKNAVKELFLCFFVRSMFSAVSAKFLEFKLLLSFFHLYHFGLMRKVVHLFTLRAHQFGICFSFCCHDPTNYEFIRIYEYDLFVGAEKEN